MIHQDVYETESAMEIKECVVKKLVQVTCIVGQSSIVHVEYLTRLVCPRVDIWTKIVTKMSNSHLLPDPFPTGITLIDAFTVNTHKTCISLEKKTLERFLLIALQPS